MSDRDLIEVVGTQAKRSGLGTRIDLREYALTAPSNVWTCVQTMTDLEIGETQRIILANASALAITVTLPTAVGQTFPVCIKKTDTGVNAVTVRSRGGQYIGTDETYITLTSPNECLWLISDQERWQILIHGGRVWWEDLRVPLSSAKLGGVHDPGYAMIQTNGAGSQGVGAYVFDAGTEEELFFECQMPHCWKPGTNIKPHVHWSPTVNGIGGQQVSWGLEYSWANIGSEFAATTLIYGDEHYPADSILVADRHYMTSLGTISGTGKTISSMLACRVFRDAGGWGGHDNYASDAALLEIDFHYASEQPGSRQELVY